MRVAPALVSQPHLKSGVLAWMFLPLVLLFAPLAAHTQEEAALPDAPAPAATAANAGNAVDGLAAAYGATIGEAASGDVSRGVPGEFDEIPSLSTHAEPVDDPGPAWDAPVYQPLGGQTLQGAHLNLNALFRSMDRPSGDAMDPNQGPEKYHFKMLVWESLAFTGVEDTYRLFTDSFFRRLLADGPYWQDYADSLGQWNMRRWWDGDDFLVDDIGHPMQGGVSSFIEIQNSPRQRELRFGMNREYWRSRFLGMMWATVFSTQQKIGPLGEAALGNAGGYTYALNCPFPCKSYTPGVTKYTNNTGWTDFIITPTVGTLWVILEDILDLEVSDRVMGDRYEAVLPQLLRGALNPCRTMANAMRWRKPWYRDYQHGVPNTYFFGKGGVHFLRGDEEATRNAPRFEVFPHFNAISLPVNTASCFRCRQSLYGFGVGFASRINHYSDFESDIAYQPNASPAPSDRAGGSIVMGTFGLRGGWTKNRGSLKASIRPGFLSYSRAYETSPVPGKPTPDIGRITHFIAALAVSGDVVVNRHLSLRGVIGNTAVRYRDSLVRIAPAQKPPYFNWLSRSLFITNENWTYQAGPVLRF